MNGMFNKSKFNQDLSGWNVSNTKNISYMFSNSNFEKNLDNWILQLNSNCNLYNFNKESKHRENFGIINSYKDFIEKQLTNEFIEDIFKSNNDKDKYQLLKIIKQYPHIVKNLDIGREIV